MLNKVNLIGTLGKDPEIRYMSNGNPVCTLSLATNEKWKDKQTGEKKESTEWHKVIFFSPVANICEKYLSKGSKIYVEGSIHTRKWQDNNGQDKYSTEIKGREMKMLGGPKKEESSSQPAQQPASSGYTADDFDTDVPF